MYDILAVRMNNQIIITTPNFLIISSTISLIYPFYDCNILYLRVNKATT